MATDKNLMKLAKNSKEKKPVPVTTKKVVEKKVEKQISPEEERELKAKAKVNELLKDIDLTLKKDNKQLIEIETDGTKVQNIEWLQEQVTLLSEKCEKLETDLQQSKNDYSKLYNEFQKVRGNNPVQTRNDSAIKAKVLELFDEIQTNHIKLGTDPYNGIGNFRIYCPGFLNRMINFFPFLAEHKRY